ncbi:MAG: hypothetical protein ABEJ26_08305 [Halosimplex sp.]
MSTLVAATCAGRSLEGDPWSRLLLVHEPTPVVALKAAVVLYAGVVLLACRSTVERVPGRARFLGVIGLGTAVVPTTVYVGHLAVASL